MDKDLRLIKERVYDPCGFVFNDFKQNQESQEYCACSFQLNEKCIHYRQSKITPTKNGQFVTLWQRSPEGITVPMDSADDLDFVFITSRKGNDLGQFIFPKFILQEKGILSITGKGGKRGFRVYPPWEIASSPQAIKTQLWQTTYFIPIYLDKTNDLEQLKRRFNSFYRINSGVNQH